MYAPRDVFDDEKLEFLFGDKRGRVFPVVLRVVVTTASTTTTLTTAALVRIRFNFLHHRDAFESNEVPASHELVQSVAFLFVVFVVLYAFTYIAPSLNLRDHLLKKTRLLPSFPVHLFHQRVFAGHRSKLSRFHAFSEKPEPRRIRRRFQRQPRQFFTSRFLPAYRQRVIYRFAFCTATFLTH